METSDYGEFLEIAEDLNLRTMDIVTKAGFAVDADERQRHEDQQGGRESRRQRAERPRVLPLLARRSDASVFDRNPA